MCAERRLLYHPSTSVQVSINDRIDLYRPVWNRDCPITTVVIVIVKSFGCLCLFLPSRTRRGVCFKDPRVVVCAGMYVTEIPRPRHDDSEGQQGDNPMALVQCRICLSPSRFCTRTNTSIATTIHSPSPSLSNKEKASLNSAICSSVS